MIYVRSLTEAILESKVSIAVQSGVTKAFIVDKPLERQPFEFSEATRSFIVARVLNVTMVEALDSDISWPDRMIKKIKVQCTERQAERLRWSIITGHFTKGNNLAIFVVDKCADVFSASANSVILTNKLGCQTVTAVTG
ncbi:hypothetical protein CAPTEDRAFT_196948 [Capitella teleta]|uniref:Uncharacterized protein n=1 Tax=Capitella teleta TaxID=283909 RepID=R7TIP3_CAPTE|nr:hypothetical protein CAPTEDRAFT_196948 [Capitella teleta]|eukprot:ELT90960.1 hypothetical protein CAPTEDRAFT_196948 [Capitella teleta]